ncbi:hypothetical protein Tco_1211695 [Tanacetum coccineum]
MAMAQTLIKMKEQKAKEKGVAFREEEEAPRITSTRSITTLQPLPTIDPKVKGKSVLVEEESDPSVKVKRSDQRDSQIQADAELAKLLHQEKLAELERRQKDGEAQEKSFMDAIYEEYDDIQASIDPDALFAAKLQQEGREQFTIEERAKFLAETIEAQRKFRAAQRAAEIRSKPPTKTQLRNMMMTFLKNMEKLESEGKSAGGVRRKTVARKRIGAKLDKDSTKRKKTESTAEEQESAKSDEEEATDYEQEKKELKMWLKVIHDEEEIMDPEILSAKYPIVDWESQTLGSSEVEDLHVYKIIRADGNTSYHKTLSSMLRKFDIQDLVDLHRLVMKRFEDSAPEDGTLTCFNMLVEKRYPLIKEMLQTMLNWKLEAEAESTMAFELLKFIKSQLEE